MNRSLTELVKHIGKLLATSSEGYGIFNRYDNLLGCNQAFATLFGGSPNKFIHLHFGDIIRHAFSTQKGIKINSDDIEEWLAMTKRRSQEFRVFEIDLLDGRWFLVSEQILASGEMWFQARDINTQKDIEFKLSAKSSCGDKSL
jgi:hypothetical protein